MSDVDIEHSLARMQVLSALLVVHFADCGARSGLLTVDHDGGSADATLPTCSPGPRPTPGPLSNQTYAAPPPFDPITIDDGTGHTIWVGGLRSSGVYADTIGQFDAQTGMYEPLTVTGDSVQLPVAGGAVWDPVRRRGIVLGGDHGSADLAQVFAVEAQGGSARVQRLPDLPTPMISYPAAAYDPTGDRLVATAFLSGGTQAELLASRETWTLDLAHPGSAWSRLLPGDAGLPTTLPGEFGWMTYDPSSGLLVQLREGNRFNPGTLWTLDPRHPTGWRSGGTLDLGALDSYAMGGPVVDTASCGLLVLATTGTCGFRLVWLGVGADGRVTVDLRGDATQPRSSNVQAYGTVVFSATRDQVLVVRGGSCEQGDLVINGAVQIDLAR